MDVTATLDAPHPPERLFPLVDDLGRYPEWLDIVPRAEACPDEDGAWSVDLRGRLGPFARSKRLRMIRTERLHPTSVRFERRETDGRRHSPWVLTATLTPLDASGCRLTVHLHYGGSLWWPALDRILADEIERSRTRLLQLAAA